MAMGGLVGTVRLINIVHESDVRLIVPTDGKWSFGPYAYLLVSQKLCEVELAMPECDGGFALNPGTYGGRYKAGVKDPDCTV